MDLRQVSVPEDGLSRVIARELSARISRARFLRRGAITVGGIAGLGLLDSSTPVRASDAGGLDRAGA
jgi:hypothetical protein